MRTLPRVGVVTAAPHEHLIQLRRGRVVFHAQGGSCFKWWNDTVALVDTSVHRLQFTADQVTREKTGVAVTGLAVFRVVSPLVAWRMLDLSDPTRHHEILREMFVGATRRLVANLSLEECLTRRKDALAAELMREIAPVVEGQGQVGDKTDRGWGVSLDTIEVQDVRVLSDEVFEQLQAAYRQGLALEALAAHEQVEREQARLRAEQARRAEETRRALMAQQEARLEAERERERQAAEHAARVAELEAEARLAREQRVAEARRQDAARNAQTRREQAALDEAAELERLQKRAQAERDAAEVQAEAERIRGAARAEVSRLERASLDAISEARLRELMLTETLPQVAAAFRDSYDHVTIAGGDLGFLGQGLAQVMGVLDGFGVSLPGSEGAVADG